MLVLSRRKDETIMIGDDVEITIVDIKGDTVRLGIAAPKSVSVHRKEIYEAIQAENIAAAHQGTVSDAVVVGGLAALLKRPTGGSASTAPGAGMAALTTPAAAPGESSALSGLGALLSGRVPPPAPPPESAARVKNRKRPGGDT